MAVYHNDQRFWENMEGLRDSQSVWMTGKIFQNRKKKGVSIGSNGVKIEGTD